MKGKRDTEYKAAAETGRLTVTIISVPPNLAAQADTFAIMRFL